ncbi:MAG: antibiotic biosynthesis monooxygenase [Acidobacteria bacterium]|nr:antibiotic biosynthesis monooxygenase [Acidobacteriota bacterium]
MAKMVLGVVARILAKPGRVVVVREGLTALLAPTRREPGCVTYQLMQNAQDPSDFTFYEQWTDAAALDAHSQSAHIAAAFSQLGDHLAAPPAVRRYSYIQP